LFFVVVVFLVGGVALFLKPLGTEYLFERGCWTIFWGMNFSHLPVVHDSFFGGQQLAQKLLKNG